MAVILLGVACALPLRAQTNQTSSAADDFSDIEAFLKQSDTERKQSMSARVDAAITGVKGFMANDNALVNAYKDAYEAVNFEGAKKEHAAVKAWEDANKAMFKDDAFAWALRAHCRYLVATLMKKSGKDDEAARATMEWIENFPTTGDRVAKVAKYEVLTGGVGASVFLAASHQAVLAQGIPNWHVGDLTNLPEMHRQNLIGWLRSKKDDRIFEQWQYNIKLEEAAASLDGLAAKKQDFARNRRPWLLWQVGRDFAFYGQKRKAAEVMKGALMESPTCTDYDAIEAEMWQLIGKTKPVK